MFVLVVLETDCYFLVQFHCQQSVPGSQKQVSTHLDPGSSQNYPAELPTFACLSEKGCLDLQFAAQVFVFAVLVFASVALVRDPVVQVLVSAALGMAAAVQVFASAVLV